MRQVLIVTTVAYVHATYLTPYKVCAIMVYTHTLSLSSFCLSLPQRQSFVSPHPMPKSLARGLLHGIIFEAFLSNRHKTLILVAWLRSGFSVLHFPPQLRGALFVCFRLMQLAVLPAETSPQPYNIDFKPRSSGWGGGVGILSRARHSQA